MVIVEKSWKTEVPPGAGDGRGVIPGGGNDAAQEWQVRRTVANSWVSRCSLGASTSYLFSKAIFKQFTDLDAPENIKETM